MADRPAKQPAGGAAAYADIEAAARDAGCADSCSSLDEHGRPYGNSGMNSSGGGSGFDGISGGGGDAYSRHGGGGGGALEWEADDDAGMAYDDDGPPPEPPSWWGAWRRCRGGVSGVALICLLLTMGAFVVPESEDGIGLVMKRVHEVSLLLHFVSGTHETAAIAPATRAGSRVRYHTARHMAKRVP